jgi:uncharacterized protein DUF6532
MEKNSTRLRFQLWRWFWQRQVSFSYLCFIILTSRIQIECCIDEWISGIRTDIPFSTALYKDVYEDHIRCLERFNKITKQLILPNILVKLYNRGRYDFNYFIY